MTILAIDQLPAELLNDENTKEKKNFVLFKFRVFVINPFRVRTTATLLV